MERLYYNTPCRLKLGPLSQAQLRARTAYFINLSAIIIINIGLLIWMPGSSKAAYESLQQALYTLNQEILVKNTAATASSIVLPQAGIPAVKKEDPEFVKITKLIGKTYGISPDLLWALAMVKSDGNPDFVSKDGALGLLGLSPALLSRYEGVEAFNVYDNIEIGAEYLRELLDNYHGDVDQAVAAFLTGPTLLEQNAGFPVYPLVEKDLRRVMILIHSRTDS
jgi:soluble lytic murein transglycosylase-like protein